MEKRTLKLDHPYCFDPSTLIPDDKIRTPKIWNMEKDSPGVIHDGLIDKIYRDGNKWLVDIINLSEEGIKALDKQKVPIVKLVVSKETNSPCEFHIIPVYFLNKPTKKNNIYSVICENYRTTYVIAVKAFDEEDAWNVFWDKIVDDQHIIKDDFGEKESYKMIEIGHYVNSRIDMDVKISKISFEKKYEYIWSGNI